MRCNLALGCRHSFLVGAMTACLLAAWPAIALRSSDPSPSLTVPLPLPDSPTAIVALRFPDLSPAEVVALRFPDLSPAEIVAQRFPKASTSTSPPNAASAPVASLASAPVASPPLGSLVHLIDFQVASVLPPIGLSRFCLRYSDDCKVHVIDFRRRNIVLTPKRLAELNLVNRRVNSGIFAAVTPGDGVSQEWVISPAAGDCKDYAVTKRHELLARGWPSRALLLSEVIVPDGQHHLVLVVRTKETDLVLDNLNPNVRPVSATHRQYQWIRVEMPQNPKFWAR